MSAIRRLAIRIFGFGAGSSLALVFAIIFINSLRRYTIGKSVAWGEELPIYLTVYGVMFGIALAYLQDKHVNFTILADGLPGRFRQRLLIAVDVATMAVGSVLAWSGILFALRRGGVEASGLIGTARAMAEGTGAGAKWLIGLGHMGTWQAAIGIGGAMLAIAAAIRVTERIQGH